MYDIREAAQSAHYEKIVGGLNAQMAKAKIVFNEKLLVQQRLERTQLDLVQAQKELSKSSQNYRHPVLSQCSRSSLLSSKGSGYLSISTSASQKQVTSPLKTIVNASSAAKKFLSGRSSRRTLSLAPTSEIEDALCGDEDASSDHKENNDEYSNSNFGVDEVSKRAFLLYEKKT